MKKANLIRACFFTPTSNGWGLPLVLIGQPGVAKSTTFRDLGKATNLHCEILSIGERGEGALGVTPVPTGENGGTVLEYPPPEWKRSLRTEGGEEAGWVLVDEINTAPPALQPALMGLVLDKRIGGSQLGNRVRIFGAMNPVGHAAGGWDIAAPVANRFGHLQWDPPTADEWASWLVGGAGAGMEPIDVDAEEARVMRAWPEAWAQASGLVAAFTRRRPELLHKMPADNDPAQSGPWPSPRTWEFATRALATAQVHGLTEVETDELISAFVGVAAAAEFVAWIEAQDLPNPADLLDGNVQWTHDPQRLDRTAAVLGACTALVAPKNAVKRDKRAEALWAIMQHVAQDAKDLTVPSITSLAEAGLQKSPIARKVLSNVLGVLDAARKGS
jgi:MoxR-like ATPase